MKDFKTEIQTWPVIIMVLSFVMSLVGSVLSNGNDGSSLACVFCTVFVILAYFADFAPLYVVALAPLYILSGDFVDQANLSVGGTTAGYVLMLVAMWLAFLSRAPADTMDTLKGSFGGLTIVAWVATFCVFIGSILFWTSVDNGFDQYLAPSFSALVHCAVVMYALLFDSVVYQKVALMWGCYVQYDLMFLVLQNTDGTSQAAACICWISFWVFNVLLIGALGGLSRELNVGSLASLKGILLLVCLVVAIIGASVAGSDSGYTDLFADEAKRQINWTYTLSVFAVVGLVIVSIFGSSMAKECMTLVAGAFMFAVSGPLVTFAHLAYETSRETGSVIDADQFVAGISLLLIAMWGSFLCFAPGKQDIGVTYMTMQQDKKYYSQCAILLFLNTIGVMFWWIYTDKDVARLPTLPTLAFINGFFYLVAFTNIKGAVASLVGLFTSSVATVLVMTYISGLAGAGSEAALGQLGASLCWFAHAGFVTVCALQFPKDGGSGGEGGHAALLDGEGMDVEQGDTGGNYQSLDNDDDKPLGDDEPQAEADNGEAPR